MCNLYRLSKGPAEIAKLFGGLMADPVRQRRGNGQSRLSRPEWSQWVDSGRNGWEADVGELARGA